MAYTEIEYLQLCIQLIEKELKWVSSEKWKQRDYLYLIDIIENKTGISLSLSTIKRIWKKENKSIPQPATLDALAQFLDYESWMHFKKSRHDPDHKETLRTRKSIPVRTLIATMAVILVSIAVIIFSKLFDRPKQGSKLVFNPEEVEFSCDYSASSGVPNTAIFRYNVTEVNADSFSIQQSWDELQRETVGKSDRFFTCMYYYPGSHRAKLFANDSIIMETDVRIYTQDWLSMVRDGYMDQVPVYISDKSTVQNGVLHVTQDHFLDNQVTLNENTIVSYYFVRDFPEISSSNFRFQTRVRCDSVFNITCPHVTICVLGEENMDFVPLIAKGCVGYMNVKMGDALISGRNNDLSSFGVDIYSWQELGIYVKENIASISLNGEQVLELPFEENVGDIVGFNINFTGTGLIDYVKLMDGNGELVYDTEFGSAD
jgi:hypothetical protein